MARRRLVRRIATRFLLGAVVALGIAALLAVHAVRASHQREAAGELLPRAARPAAAVESDLRAATAPVAAGAAGAVAAVFAAAALWLSRRIGRPLDEMRETAERLSRGDLAARAPVRGSEDEIADLAASLNRMAVQMEERLRAITRQKNEQAAVLEGMVEGVLAVDREERVLRMNGAAARLLGVAPEAAAGRSLQEVVRSVELQRLVRQVLAGGGAAECEFVLYGEQERHIECHCTVPPDPSGAGPGALVVLHDITRLKRLEAVRRDFVANVSHELKTPITAIQGCADTLLDGGASGPEETRRFLEMLRRHAGRLASIVEDLLRLSRIESDAEHGRIATEPGCVAEVLRSAVRSLGPAAAARRIALAVECPDRMPARINASLLEQAVGNLVDNAVKYAPEGSRVLVSGIEGEREVEIRVSDEGPGIERKHLPRLFERFYRVDPARSRAGGGTGLGLAIVKHIAQAHRGSVGVESAPGRGSSFFIRIPRQS